MRGKVPIIAFSWVLTALVLLVACANVGNLMLARAVARSHEIGVRLALAAGAIFGGVPAWRAARSDVRPLIAGAGPGAGDGTSRRSRLQATFVVAQVTLCVILLFTAGLFARRVQVAGATDLGYDADRVVAFSFDLYAQRYGPEARAAFIDELQARVATIPGVESATVPAFIPLAGGGAIVSVQRVGETSGDAGIPAAGTGQGAAITIAVGVGEDYFRTLGIPILHGRALEAHDIRASADVAVVSESLARRLWPGQNAVGRRIIVGSGESAREVEVVGVARDVVASDVVEGHTVVVCLPHGRLFAFARTTLAVRTAGAPVIVIRAVREEIRRMDPALPVFDVQTLAQIVDRELGL